MDQSLIIDATDQEELERQLQQKSEQMGIAKDILTAELDAISRFQTISVQFKSHHDIQSVLYDILDATLDILHADMSNVRLFDNDAGKLYIRDQRGFEQLFRDYFGNVHEGQAVYDAAIVRGEHVIVEDIAQDPIFANTPELEVFLSSGIRSIQSTPLRGLSGKLLGVLSICYRTLHPPEKREQILLDMIVRITSDIIEWVQSDERLQRSRIGTEKLYEIAGLLLENDHPKDIIKRIFLKAMEYLNSQVFLNYLFDEKKQQLHLSIHEGISEDQAKELEWFELDDVLFDCDTKDICIIKAENICENDAHSMQLIYAYGIKVCVCCSLKYHNELVGALVFGLRNRNTFNEEEIMFIKAIAKNISAAFNRIKIEENLRRVTKELINESQHITDFFTNISHEFKTPISIMLVQLELMHYHLIESIADNKDELNKDILITRQNTYRLCRLVNNLLDITKIDAGFMRLILRKEDIIRCIHKLTESVRDYGKSLGLEISFESTSKEKQMPVDIDKIDTIVLNLLSNSMKHTPSGGHIRTSIQDEGKKVLISVKDDGEGIPEDKQGIIFDRFRQVNTSLTRTSEGSGIGLSLTKALVKLLHGRIWFSSKKGEGSEFFVELPVLDIDEQSSLPIIEGLSLNRKVEMEFSDIDFERNHIV
jgi:signal transduction histidine kinase